MGACKNIKLQALYKRFYKRFTSGLIANELKIKDIKRERHLVKGAALFANLYD